MVQNCSRRPDGPVHGSGRWSDRSMAPSVIPNAGTVRIGDRGERGVSGTISRGPGAGPHREEEQQVKVVLRKTSLHVGNQIAWFVMVFCMGLAAGWILNAERMYGYCVVP